MKYPNFEKSKGTFQKLKYKDEYLFMAELNFYV